MMPMTTSNSTSVKHLQDGLTSKTVPVPVFGFAAFFAAENPVEIENRDGDGFDVLERM